MTHAATTRTDIFEQQRPRLFSIAYRLLGTRADAEDVLQECWLRWDKVADTEIQSPGAWLSTVTTRLCLDQLRSAEARRVTYIGAWLPEPVAEPQQLADSLSYAFFVFLQTLSPQERCVLLLRDVFQYEYAELAKILDTGEANCRKLLERARKQLEEGRARRRINPEEHRELLHRFAKACGTGDASEIESLFAESARLRTDGGGKVRSALNPILGADRIARFFAGILKKLPEGATTLFTDRFGEPAIETHVDGRLHSVLFIEPDPNGTHIREMFVVANPDKLG